MDYNSICLVLTLENKSLHKISMKFIFFILCKSRHFQQKAIKLYADNCPFINAPPDFFLPKL